MKRLLILFLLACAPAFCQSTTVSGQALDANGQVFAGGTYQFTFFPSPVNPTGPYFWNGVPFNKNMTVSGVLGNSGNFSVSVPSNDSITPSQSKWVLTVSPASTSQGYSTTALTITGSTQNVTAAITPPAIQVQAAPRVAAYQDSEIIGAAPGFVYSNLTSNVLRFCEGTPCTWITIGSGGGGGTGPCLATQGCFDVTSTTFGAKCDASTDDTAAFQAAFNAAASAPSGTVYIPWNSPITAPVTNALGCVIKGGLTMPSTSYWINVLQVGNILQPSNATAPLLSGALNNIWWLGVNGQGAGIPGSFVEPSAPTIMNYSNLPTISSANATNVRLENLSFQCPSTTTANCLNFTSTASTGYLGLALVNVDSFSTGTGIALNMDCSTAIAAGNGCFNIKILGGVFVAASTATKKASIFINGGGAISIGDPNRRMLLGGYGITLQDTGSVAGSGLMHVQNILTEAMAGPVITLKVTGAGGGINSVAIDRVDLADCIVGTCYIVGASGLSGSGVSGVSVSNSSGAPLLDPASTFIQGIISTNNFEVNDGTAPPSSVDLTTMESGQFLRWAANNLANAFNIVRGHGTFGCAEPGGNGSNMSCDPLNGDAGYGYSSLPGGGNGAVHRFTSGAADAFLTFESPAGSDIFQLLFCKTGGGCPGAVNYTHTLGLTFTWEGHAATLQGTVGGALGVISGATTPGDCVQFAAGPALTDTGSPCGSGGGGGGTVTHTAGALTANQLVLGNGSADIKVGNLSGDVLTSGSAVTALANVPDLTHFAGRFQLTPTTNSSTPSAGHSTEWFDSGTGVFTAQGPSTTNLSITIFPSTLASHNFATGVSTSGAITGAQPAFTDVSGAATYAQLPVPSSNGDVICSTGGVYAECTPGRVVTNETGSGSIHTFAQSDNNALYTQSNASASAYTLPIISSLSTGWSVAQLNIGAGTVTTSISTSTATVCSGSSCSTAQTSFALTTGQFALVYSNSSGYFVKIF